ncbi:hypothetical protein KCP70_19455 [Salmonella enterica subsp. enterica]|nr:hypothetical protein KCP70_19455 [Salmonella enterica subsp. enterica]
MPRSTPRLSRNRPILRSINARYSRPLALKIGRHGTAGVAADEVLVDGYAGATVLFRIIRHDYWSSAAATTGFPPGKWVLIAGMM